jgi:hypothetical protein
VLKPGSKCAVLIGDTRQRKHVVPIGFKTIEVFLEAGFRLKELVIKRQHNCKTTGFWYKRSVEHNFLLLAHEYLPIFEKPATDVPCGEFCLPSFGIETLYSAKVEASTLETTTVWIFPQENLKEQVDVNLYQRYGGASHELMVIRLTQHDTRQDTQDYYTSIQAFAQQALSRLQQGEFVIVETRDVRFGGQVVPLAKIVVDALQLVSQLRLKEIIIVVPSNLLFSSSTDELDIVHRYLLVYEVTA